MSNAATQSAARKIVTVQPDPMVARCVCVVACEGECRRPKVLRASEWTKIESYWAGVRR